MKYILEIKPEYEGTTKGIIVLGIKNNCLCVDELALEELEELNSDYINEHFGSLQDDAYKRGLEDGKAIHEKGCEGCKFEGTEIYHRPCCACRNVYPNQWTAKDDKIEVGDEVTHKSESVTWTAVVTKNDNGLLTLMGSSGAIADDYDEKNFVKTGRHFDIAKILEEMKHD